MTDPREHDDERSADPLTGLLADYLATGALAPDAGAGFDPRQRAELLDALGPLEGVRDELGSAAAWDEPPADLEASVVDVVVAAARRGRDDVLVMPADAIAGDARSRADGRRAATPAGDHPADATPVVSLEDRLRRSERTQHRLRAFAVAASFVALLAGVVAVVSVANRETSIATPPSSATSTAVTPTSPSTTPSTTAPGTSEPDVDVKRDLVASDLVPGVTGEVGFKETDSGLRIYFDADNLPHCSQGKVYEAWVKTTQGKDVSVGTFHGGTDVTLWAGVDLPQVRGFWVSLQNEGDHAPSDQRVVSASLVTPPAGSTTTTSTPS